MQKSRTISVFQKLWPFVSAHVRAFPTFKPISKSTYSSRFYYNCSLPASKLGFISNFSYFPSLQVVEFNSSVSKEVVLTVLPSKLEHGLVEFLGSKQSSTPWSHFGLKYPIETLFQSWISSRNQISNYARVVSRRKSSFEGLNFEEITPFRSLEDDYGTISGLYYFVRTSVETA